VIQAVATSWAIGGMLAAGPLGCAAQNGVDQSRSTAARPNDPAQVDEMKRYLGQKAVEADLPRRYVSEAMVNIVEVREKLADADAADAERKATLEERLAHIEATRQRIQAEQSKALSETQKLEQQYRAEQQQMQAELVKNQREIAASAQEREALVAAMGKSKRTLQDDHDDAHLPECRQERTAVDP